MTALLEEQSCLGTNQHHPLVLVCEQFALLLLRLGETFSLALRIELTKALHGITRQPAPSGLPQSCIIQKNQLGNGLLQVVGEHLSCRECTGEHVQHLVGDRASPPQAMGNAPPSHLMFQKGVQ